MKKMVKRYIIDLLLITIFAASAFIIAERPEVEHKANLQDEDIKIPQTLQDPAAFIAEEGRNKKPVIPTYKNIKERNIFAMDGRYAISKELKPRPENLYRLIAILQGNEKRAVFMKYTGLAASLKVGDELIDGTIIINIDNLSVKTKKGRETKEYRIFDVKP